MQTISHRSMGFARPTADTVLFMNKEIEVL